MTDAVASEPAAQSVAIGARVRAARTTRGLSLRTLAREVQVSPATLSQLETGKTRLSVVRLEQIATALGHSMTDILSAPLESAPVVTPLRIHSAGADPLPISDWRVYGSLGLDPVLTAALQAFLSTGYHGATVRDIARSCGLSVSGIYHHYPTKHDMLRTILELGVSELLTRAELARAEGRDTVSRFSLMIESLVLFHTYRRDVGFIGASEMRSLDPPTRRLIAEQRMLQQRMIDDEAIAGVAQGLFRTDHPREAARAAVTMCTSVAQWFNADGQQTPAVVAAQYVRFALDMLGHRAE